jgi:hypothetical protein
LFSLICGIRGWGVWRGKIIKAEEELLGKRDEGGGIIEGNRELSSMIKVYYIHE